MTAGETLSALRSCRSRRFDGRDRGPLVDIAIITGFVVLAAALYRGLWSDLGHGYLVGSGQDQNLFEWLFAAQAQAIATGGDPFFSMAQNAPLGVNLMANTAVFGLAIPLAPLTLLFGPTTTWTVILTGGLAGTAVAWYLLLARHVVPSSRLAAAVGGAFCAFAPPVISHAQAHPNFTALFVIPLIVGRLIRLRQDGPVVGTGIALALLITLQVFIGEEVLLIAAIALVVFGCAFLAAHRDRLRPVLGGLGVAAAVAVPLLAYPLAWQFFGRQSYRGMAFGASGNDLAAFVGVPSQSFGGQTADSSAFALSPTEENAFFGWTLLVLVAVLVIWLRHVRLVRILALVAAVMLVLSVGSNVVLDGTDTGLVGPWRFVAGLPVFESVLQSRLALGAVVPIGVLLALGTERAHAGTQVRLIWFGALAAALLPLVPVPFDAVRRPDVPAYVTTGAWRAAVEPGRSLVPVPLPVPLDAEPLHWQVAAGFGFTIPQGYFVGPDDTGRWATYGAIEQPTAALLAEVASTGAVPPITDRERADAVADLTFWRADAMVVDGRDPRQVALRTAVDALVGPGRYTFGMWVWDVRGFTRNR